MDENGQRKRLERLVFDRNHRAAFRFFALGFNPMREELIVDLHHGLDYRAGFAWVCMCGRMEQFAQTIPHRDLAHIGDPWLFSHFNVYNALERIGATTEKHLRDDGFAPDVIAEILRRGEEFDMRWRE